MLSNGEHLKLLTCNECTPLVRQAGPGAEDTQIISVARLHFSGRGRDGAQVALFIAFVVVATLAQG